jgi:hypothetical protein
LIATVLISTGNAHAAPDPRELQAKKACAAGKVDEGVEILADMYAQTGHITYVYNQGRCYQQNGVADKAINRFREYLRRATNITAADRQEVEQFIAELEKQQEERARRDAARTAPPPTELTPPPPVVTAPAQPPPTVEATPPPSRFDAGRMRKIGMGLGAAGVLAIGAGVVLSLKVQSFERTLEKDLARGDLDNQQLSARMRDGARLETFQWVAYGAGAALIAGGATCYLLGYRASEQSAVAWTVAPPPHGRGLTTSLRVRY